MRVTADYQGDGLGDIPAHPQGGQWAYAMAHDGDLVSFADTAGELVGVLIEGYDQIGDTEADHDHALLVRYEHLVILAAHYQGLANQAAESAGDLDVADEDTLTALYADRAEPYTGPQSWTGPPLILLATDYSPFTARPAPTGDTVTLLDPSRETTHLACLGELGFIAFGAFTGAAS
jgi:hypothetical protein